MKERREPVQLKEEAEKVAIELVEHAKETARQMLLGTNLDISKIPLICNKILIIDSNIQKITDSLENSFVRKESFDPVQKVVYGLVSLILVTVVIGMLALVINK